MCCKLPPYFTTCVKQVIPWPWYQTRGHSHSLCFRSMLWLTWVMPQSHPTMAPVRFLSPVRFIARKAEWSVRRNFASVLFSWSHQATGPVRLDTAAYLWFGWIIRRTPWVPPCDARTGIVRGPHGNLQCFSYPTGPVRGSCGTRKGAVQRPYGHIRELTQPELAKIPHGRRIWPYGACTDPLRSPHGLFTGWLQSLNPYGAHKLIMHALKLYGPRMGRQNSHGAVWGPCGPHEWTYDFCSKQPGNSPYGAGECDVTEALAVVGASATQSDTDWQLRVVTNQAMFYC